MARVHTRILLRMCPRHQRGDEGLPLFCWSCSAPNPEDRTPPSPEARPGAPHAGGINQHGPYLEKEPENWRRAQTPVPGMKCPKAGGLWDTVRPCYVWWVGPPHRMCPRISACSRLLKTRGDTDSPRPEAGGWWGAPSRGGAQPPAPPPRGSQAAPPPRRRLRPPGLLWLLRPHPGSDFKARAPGGEWAGARPASPQTPPRGPPPAPT